MWFRNRRIAEADRVVAEAEKRNKEGRQLAEQARAASRALRREAIENHFTELLIAAMQREQRNT